MNTVAGHGLLNEGAAFDECGCRLQWGTVGGGGRGRCSCGEFSAWLPSAAERKRWHKGHKADVAEEA